MLEPGHHLPNERNPKDFIEHLRTIHFTLVAVCIGLLVIVLAGKTSRYRAASEQINDISDVAAKWNPLWVFEEATKVVEAKHKETPECAPSPKSMPRIPPSLQFGRTWTLNPSNKLPVQLATNQFGIERYEISAPTTLDAFRQYWESTFSLTCAVPTENVVLMGARPGDDFGKPIVWSSISFENKPNGLPVPYPMFLTLKPKKSIFSGNLPKEVAQDEYIFEVSGWNLPFPSPVGRNLAPVAPIQYVARAKSIASGGTLALNQMLARKLEHKSWQSLNFHDQFREVDELTTGFQDLDFKHLRNILELQEKNSQEVFEAFGIKFPIESTTRWGLVIILAIQLYFLIHLIELKKKDYSSPDIAWIGVYAGTLPKSLFFSTTVALPIAAVALLSVKVGLGLSHAGNITLGASAAILATVLAVSSWRKYLRRPAASTN
jgi:hypothetical protein